MEADGVASTLIPLVERLQDEGLSVNAFSMRPGTIDAHTAR